MNPFEDALTMLAGVIAILLNVAGWGKAVLGHPIFAGVALVGVGWGGESVAYFLTDPWSVWRGLGFAFRTALTVAAAQPLVDGWVTLWSLD